MQKRIDDYQEKVSPKKICYAYPNYYIKKIKYIFFMFYIF